MVTYLVNVGGPVSLVLDLHIRSDPPLNGHLHYTNRKYHSDCNNNPSNSISFIPTIVSTSGRLDNEFVCLSFLHSHRETDHFFATSGVQYA